MGWCSYNNVTYTSQRCNFIGQLRAILGPRRCLPRTKESSAQAVAAGRRPNERRNLPIVDAGFKLRDGILSQSSHALSHGTRHDFKPDKMGSGGLEEIANLPQAKRIDVDSGLSRGSGSGQSQGPVSGLLKVPEAHGCNGSEEGQDSVSGQDWSPLEEQLEIRSQVNSEFGEFDLFAEEVISKVP